MKALPSLLLLCTLLGVSAPAAEPTPANAASVPAVADKIFGPEATAELRAQVGRMIVVEGSIVADRASKTGSMHYLNFTKNFSESVSLVVPATLATGALAPEKLKEYVGKRIRVRGTLSEYKGALQVKLESADQIMPAPAPAP